MAARKVPCSEIPVALSQVGLRLIFKRCGSESFVYFRDSQHPTRTTSSITRKSACSCSFTSLFSASFITQVQKKLLYSESRDKDTIWLRRAPRSASLRSLPAL